MFLISSQNQLPVLLPKILLQYSCCFYSLKTGGYSITINTVYTFGNLGDLQEYIEEYELTQTVKYVVKQKDKSFTVLLNAGTL